MDRIESFVQDEVITAAGLHHEAPRTLTFHYRQDQNLRCGSERKRELKF